MRVSTQQIHNTGLSQMLNTQTELAKSNERIASQKAILRPSDDPVASAQILKLERELAEINKYADNLNAAERRLDLSETVLTQFDTAIDRLSELAIQAGSGTYNDADRATMADEVKQIQSFLMSLMNTKDSQGEFVFAGSLGTTTPYVDNGDGTFTYNGDDSQRVIEVGSDLRVAMTDSGRSIFSVIGDDLQVNVLGQASNRSDLATNVMVTDSDELAEYVAEHGNLTAAIKVGLDTGDGNYTYSVRDSSGAAVSGEVNDSGSAVTFDGLPFTTSPMDMLALSDAGLRFDLNELPAVGAGLDDSRLSVGVYQDTPEVNSTRVNNVTLLSDPAGDDYAQFAAAEGDVSVSFTNDGSGNLTYTVSTESSGAILGPVSYVPGDEVTITDGVNDLYSFTIDEAQPAGASVTLRAQAEVTLQPEQNHHTILQTTEEFIRALETPLSSQEAKNSFSTAVSKIMGEFTEAKEGNLSVITQLGSRLNSVESAREVNLDYELFTESALSAIQDLDMAEAISQFKLQEMALQASQATFAKINSLSLFNYL